MRHKFPITLILCLSLLATLNPSALAQRAKLAKLNVGYSAISSDQLPAWVAKEAGIFDRNGLDVQLIFFTGGTTAILTLISRDVPVTPVSGPGLVNSVFAGSDAGFFAGGITPPNLRFIGR